MKIEVQLDEKCTETMVKILSNKMSQEVNDIMQRLSAVGNSIISGVKDDSLEIIEPSEIIRVYSANQKRYAHTSNGEYLLRLRLYELEEKLDSSVFARISNSEIINLKKVQSFDLSFSGTICVKLHCGVVTYVSRRYVTKIKNILGI